LQEDNQTINCTGTGLGDGPYTIEITYRGGWTAYNAQSSVSLRLLDGATSIELRPLFQVGRGLGVIYLTPTEVTAAIAAGLTFSDVNGAVRIEASPLLWSSPTSLSATPSWHATATLVATELILGPELIAKMKQVEQDQGLALGTYVSNELITAQGAAVVNSGWPFFDEVVPTVFETNSYSALSEAPDPGTFNTGYLTQIINEAADNSLGNMFTGFSISTFGNASHTYLIGTVLALIVGLILAVVITNKLNSPGFAAMSFFAVLLLFTLAGGVSPIFMFLVAVLLITYGIYRVVATIVQ